MNMQRVNLLSAVQQLPFNLTETSKVSA